MPEHAIDEQEGPALASWSKTEKLALSLFSCCVVASLAVLTHPWNELVRDASTYIVVSKSLVAGEGYRYLEIPFNLRPPGFPLLIAPILAIWGVDFSALNLLTSAIGALGVILLFATLRDSLGWLLALLVATAVWLNPMFRELCNQTMSDVPSLTLVVACLWVERRSGPATGWKREVALGGLLGLSILVRSVNWLLLAAVVASRLLRRLRTSEARAGWGAWTSKALLLPIAVAIVVVLPWHLYRDANQAPAVDDQIGIHSYATAMLHADWGDPTSQRVGIAEILERVMLRSDQLATVLGSRLSVDRFGNERADRGASAVEILVAAALIAALLLAAWMRGEPIEIFCLAIVPVTLFYFGFRSRLLLPVFVLTLPCALWLIQEFARRRGWRDAGTRFAIGLVVAMIVIDFDPRPDWPDVETKHIEWARTCDALETVLQPDARIATRLGTHLAVCLDQPIYSLEFATRRLDMRRGLDAVIGKYGINTLVLEAHSALAREVSAKLGAGTPVASMRVWRLEGHAR